MATTVIKLSSPSTHQFWEIPVLYEDEHLLALDKPPALPVSPDRREPKAACLLHLLHAGIAGGKPWARERHVAYLTNTHRLEPETSGLLLFARSKAIFLELANRFSSGQPGLTFLALAHGAAPNGRFEIDAKLGPDLVRPGLLRVDTRRGKRSHTQFEVAERFRNFTLLRCEPSPIRPHQIRAHVRAAGLPLVGDSFFGGRPLLLSNLKSDYRLKPGEIERPLLARPALHSAEFALVHPVTGQAITITAPLPRDLSVALKYLRRYAASGEAGAAER